MKTGCFAFVREEILFPLTFCLAFVLKHEFSIPQGFVRSHSRTAALSKDYNLSLEFNCVEWGGEKYHNEGIYKEIAIIIQHILYTETWDTSRVKLKDIVFVLEPQTWIAGCSLLPVSGLNRQI